MYQVTLRQLDGQPTVIHSAYVDTVKLTEAKITKAVNSIEKFEFTCTPENPAYDSCHPFTSMVEVTKDGTVLFRGRVLKVDSSMDTNGKLTKNITCEGELAYLHDSYQNYGKWQNISPADFFKRLIDVHNSQVEPYKRFTVGTVTVTDPNNSIYRYTAEETSTFDTITDKLIKRMGGELQLTRRGDDLYLDYIKAPVKYGKQTIALTRNIRSLKQSVDASEIITVLKPLGKTQQTQSQENAGTDASQPRLTIAGVNGGNKWLRDEAKIREFGIQSGVQTWDDVTDANNLIRKGREFLASQKTATVQYQVEAIDLALIDKTVDDFECGTYYRVINPVMGVDEYLRAVGQTIDIVDVTRSTLTIGDRMLSQEELTLQAKKEILASQTDRQSIIDFEHHFADLDAESEEVKKIIADLQKQVEALKNQTNPQPTHIGKIIDVSEWQGSIDWPAVIADDTTLSIIRVQDGSSHQDLKYMENIQGVINAGGRYAVYAYFRAVSTADAQVEAQDFYNRVQKVVAGKQQPVFYALDIESIEMGGSASAMRGGVEAYMNKLNSLGIPDSQIVLYIANHLYDTFNLNVARPGAIWIPSYGINDGTLAGSQKPSHPYDLHQYTSKGTVKGIAGNVDMSTDPSDKFKRLYL